jgi:threonine/homoserine/homoserine lactone efflux protein
MLTFAAAVFLLIVTPGPGVLTTAGVGAAYGYRIGFRYVLGLFLGTNLVGLAVITGFAAFVLTLPYVRLVLTILSFGYLMYLAAKIAFAGSNLAFIKATREPNVATGVMLQIINPKAYAVNTALYTGFAFYPDNWMIEVGTKIVISNLIWIPIHIAWLWAGVSLTKLSLSAGKQRMINYAMAAALVGVVVLAIIAAQ